MKKQKFSTSKRLPAQGYTIIELLFAVVNFTFVLMIAVSAFIVVMRIYNKAAFARQTQQATRSVVDQMSNDIRLASVVTVTSSPTTSICLTTKSPTEGSVKYFLRPPNPYSDPPKTAAVIREGYATTETGCSASPTTTRQMTADSMSVTNLVFTKIVRDYSGATTVTSPELPYGTAVRIDISVTKGTSSGVSDPFYDETSFTTLVNARGGS